MLAILPFESSLFMGLIKSLLLINPGTLCMIAILCVFWFSIKTLSVKLALLGGGIILASLITYIVHRIEKKQSIKKVIARKVINLSDDTITTIGIDSEIQDKKDLSLSRMFKK